MHRIFAGLAVWATAGLVAEFVLGFMVSRQMAAGRLEAAQSMFTWHMMLGIGVGTLVTLLHVMTMFHFIGSGKEIKEHAAVLGDSAEIVRQLRRFKMLTSPLATFAPIVTGAAVILGGGAHMRAMPGWVHWSMGLAALLLNLTAFPVEYRCLKLNLQLIHDVDARIRRDLAPAVLREE